MNRYSSPVERIAPARKLTSTPLAASVNPHDKKVTSQWVTPTVCKVRPQASEDVFRDPFLACPDSSFDCGSSLISLDFGLVSPNKNWSSPPQRIERADNREWSSPHLVIDRPNPENSPGNWISMKESCFTVRHSPALGVAHSFEPPKTTCSAPTPLPNSEPRPSSQTTYVLQDSERDKNQDSDRPVKKRSVLEDYEPERAASAKKRTVGSADSVDVGFQPTNDKIRRLVDSDGHIIKISVLEDYEAPPLGKFHGAEGGEKENAVNPSVAPVRTTISSKLSPSVMKPAAKRKKVTGKGGTSNRPKISSSNKGTNKNTEEGKDEETNADDLNKDTQQIIKDLEKILKEPEKETDKAADKLKQEIPKPKKLKPPAKEEKEIAIFEKRKRNVDPKAVQEYIKYQKQKRLEQAKTEKKTKDAEREARKKKLEELRIRTLKLATQSKKKKSPLRTIKVVEPEDDVTMSLGLKQIKPKVSYNESVSKLKKKVSQQKPQFNQTETTVPPEETAEEYEISRPEAEQKSLELKKPEETVQIKPADDLNTTLKKLAESLHLKLDEKEKQLRSRSSSIAPKSVKDPLSAIPSQETIKTVKSAPPEANRQVVSVDVGTIQSLKDDIKKISENFKVLHEIIADKAELLEKSSPKKQQEEAKPKKIDPVRDTKEINWFETIVPRPCPYNVFTAYKQKINVPASMSGSSTFAEPISNKYESDFEALSIPSDRLRSIKQTVSSVKTTSVGTSEVNYYSLKDDSGSELSSSILDSDKQTGAALSKRTPATSRGSRNSSTSIVTEISSSFRLATSNTTSVRNSFKSLSSGRENLILVPPDIKLISNELQEKLNSYSKNLNVASEREGLNNSEKSLKEHKSDSTITELIDNLSESEKSLKSAKSTNEENAVQRVEDSPMRRSFFRPEMLHLQFQAELTLLETFQQSLAHFLEAERMKTLTEVNKIVYEKAINTEKFVEKEDQAIQTKVSSRSASETESVETEINVSEKSVPTEGGSTKAKTSPRRVTLSDVSEKLSTSKETLKEESPKAESRKDEILDLSNGISGISFQMLDRMMKDEELRSEHQLALIKLREKTLNEKIKAELTFLEMKKRALKERGGGDEEQSVSAIKKKQRGILLKYQSEKEEIERLKKMHKIASEERKIMIKQQKQIQQMQLTTKDMIIKLKKREKSPKKIPLKPKALKSSDSQSDIPEEISIVSDSILSGSCSVEESTRHSDLDVSSRSNVSEGEGEILRRNIKTLESKVSSSVESFKSKKSLLETEKYPRRRHSVEELLSWTKRLEEKENSLKELEKQTMSAANSARNKLTKSLKKMRDRSTSPFQFQESMKMPSDASPTEEAKKSPTISEVIDSNPRTEMTEKSDWVGEKMQSSASEDIPEQFSKKISASRTEYYSESFESPSSSETPKAKPETSKNSLSEGYKGIAIRMSLSPRMQSPRRRYSSGSDDSLNLSHTETASEQSDLESRIAALNEQLRKRKLEAERLRREQKKAQRERLRVKEQSLIKQIQAYDAYIQKKKQELEQEYEHSTQVLMKPLIKQPRAAEKVPLKHIPINETEKQNLYSRQLGAKNREKDESISEKITGRESDSEALEQMKDTSESATEQIREESESGKEQIESKIEEEQEEEEEEEEEEESKMVESLVEAETSPKESSEVGKSTSVSESLPEQEAEESQSESEEQSISIKTTLHSPERPDATEKADVVESETVEEESLRDDYQLDSFESDAEEKMTSEGTKGSEIGTEVGEHAEKETSKEGDIPEVDKTEEAERITDSILMELILESLKTFSCKKAEAERRVAEESKLTLEVLSSYLAKEIITEAVDDMLKVYNKKATEEKSWETIPQTGESRRKGDAMVTTCDVSPCSTPPREPEAEAGEREEFVRSLTHPRREEKAEDKIYSEDERNHQAETFSQDWFDEDFGLSRTRREAEELRLQQLQIEQEIQQLQAQQDQVPYFYLREIPNKPPPPYTPPGKPLSEIPTSEGDIIAVTSTAVRILADEISKGRQISDVEPTWEYYGNSGSEHVKCYKFFLFDLAKHVIGEVFEQQERKEEVLPWLRVPERLSKYKYRNIERTFECLNEYMQKQVLISFGFSKKLTKESLLVKWIKKKRDHVDEILVGESQEEECQWTQYDEDQVTVKNEVAMGILDSLLENTADVFNAIFMNKMKKK